MRALVQSPRALGRALRDVRRREGLSQKELAELAGLAQPTLSNVERGVIQVSLGTLLRLLAALKLELILQERTSTDATGPWEEPS